MTRLSGYPFSSFGRESDFKSRGPGFESCRRQTFVLYRNFLLCNNGAATWIPDHDRILSDFPQRSIRGTRVHVVSKRGSKSQVDI